VKPSLAALKSGWLVYDGWNTPDGSAPDGYYNVEDYFGEDGEYLGPDKDGIEPRFTMAEPCPYKAEPEQWVAGLQADDDGYVHCGLPAGHEGPHLVH